jgi:hypothetical protein
VDSRVIAMQAADNDDRVLRLVFKAAQGEAGPDPEAKVWWAVRLVEKADRTIARDRKRKAAAILRNRLVDYDGVKVVTINGAWPQIKHDREDKEGWLNDDTGVEVWANDNQIEAAAVVRRSFQEHMVGENQDRDWDILIALASGVSERKLEKIFSTSRANIRKRRDKQLAAITKAMRPHMTEAAWHLPIGPNSRLIKAAA